MARKILDELTRDQSEEVADYLVDAGDLIPPHLRTPVLIGGGGLFMAALWGLHFANPSALESLDDPVVAGAAVLGAAIFTFGLLEHFATPEPPPSVAPKRAATGLDAMVDDIEGRKAWVRRVIAAAAGVLHYLVFSILPNW